MQRLHLIISGRVQGVFFRAQTKDVARTLGLTGWVSNLPDGGVETLAEGEKETLEKFLEWCKHGPPSASVSNISIKWGEADGEFKSFEIRY